jgi:hypothetical protein
VSWIKALLRRNMRRRSARPIGISPIGEADQYR